MAVKTFKRGLLLSTKKHATEGKPVEIVPTPKQVVIPVNQQSAPNISLVAVGDKVKRGTKIADAAAPGPMSVPVHSSVTGTVRRIEPRAQSNNTDGLCIVIETQPDAPEELDYMPPLDPFTCTKEEALNRIRDAGIVGMGGAGFPAHVKLNTPPNKPIDLIIANGSECEPYLTTDEAAMYDKPQLLIKGIAIVMKIAGVSRAVIGIEDNKTELVPILEREIKAGEYPGTIEIALCKTKYPQGGEKMLIKALTDKEVPSGGLPMDVQCIVQNVATLIAIAEAFTLGKPCIDRDLTVSGGACLTPKNIRVPIGTLITDLPQEFMNIDYAKLRKVLFGGPMMGTAVPTPAIPIQKNTSGIILMTAEETVADSEGPCIRCARCVKNCSCFLSPVIINNALESGDMEEAVRAGLLDCVECGSCSYICPARIKLVQRFRIGKQRLRAMQIAEQAAQKAREAAAQAKAAANAPASAPANT